MTLGIVPVNLDIIGFVILLFLVKCKRLLRLKRILFLGCIRALIVCLLLMNSTSRLARFRLLLVETVILALDVYIVLHALLQQAPLIKLFQHLH